VVETPAPHPFAQLVEFGEPCRLAELSEGWFEAVEDRGEGGGVSLSVAGGGGRSGPVEQVAVAAPGDADPGGFFFDLGVERERCGRRVDAGESEGEFVGDVAHGGTQSYPDRSRASAAWGCGSGPER
jgi:hypothetical protein